MILLDLKGLLRMTGILQKEEGRSSKTLSVRLRSGRHARFAIFFLAPHTVHEPTSTEKNNNNFKTKSYGYYS